MKDLVIVSAGKFGREVLAWVNDAISAGARWRVKGFLDDRSDILSGFACGAEIIDNTVNYVPRPNDLLLPALGSSTAKRDYCQLLLDKGAKFGTLVHPLANVGPRVILGDGVILAPFTSLTCDLEVGNFVTLGVFSASAHGTRIGQWSQISGHCGINGNASLGEGVFLGSHACILPSAEVGAWAVVGAGSVVLRRVSAGARVFGNPAKVF